MESLSMQLIPVFDWLLRTTLQAALLFCLIMLVQLILRGRLPIRWHYCLWLLLLVRMATPWLPESKISVFNWVPRSIQHGGIIKSLSQPQDARGMGFYLHADTTDPRPAQAEAAIVRFVRMLPLLWLLGTAALAVYVGACNFHLWWLVTRERPLTDEKILDLLEDCKAEMGVRNILGIVTTDKVKSAALFGFVRPRLLLPAGMVEALNPKELRYVFLHELGHLRRRDIYVRWLMSLLQVLHWFNPLVWLAFYRMQSDRELACDALVLAHARSDESEDYGRTLVSLLERFSHPKRLPSMAGIVEAKSQFKRRIKMIADYEKTSRTRWAGAMLLFAVLACVVLTNAYVAKADFTFGTVSPQTVAVAAAAQPTTDEAMQKKIDELIAQLGDENVNVRLSAAAILTRMNSPRQIRSLRKAVMSIIKALEDENSHVRRDVARSLGKIGDPRAVQPLIEALGDEDESVRRDVARSLGKIGDPRAVQPLINALSDPPIRAIASIALGEIGDPQAVQPLIKKLEAENPDVRRAAARSLGRIGNPQAVQPLIEALGDEDESVRRAAARSLGRIGNPQAVQSLIKALGDKVFDVRMNVLTALGEIGDPQAVQSLIRVLGDEDVLIRFRAVEALGEIGGRQAVQALTKTLGNEEQLFRQAAVLSLHKIGGRRAVHALIKALGDEEVMVRQSAVRAIGEIGDRREIKYLRKALNDENLAVRMTAEEALRNIQGKPISIRSICIRIGMGVIILLGVIGLVLVRLLKSRSRSNTKSDY